MFHAFLPNRCFHDPNFTFLMYLRCFRYYLKFYLSGNPNDEDKSATLQKKDFNFLSKLIGDRWKRFARQFDIPDQKIVDITNQYNGEFNRCYQAFLALEAIHGLVQWKMIEMALKELGLKQVISEYSNLKKLSD